MISFFSEIDLFAEFNLSVKILLILVVLNITSLILISIKKKKNLLKFKKTFLKFMSYIISIVAIRLMEIGIEDFGFLPKENVISIFLIGILTITEVLLIVENCYKLGLPLPKQFLKIIKYLKIRTKRGRIIFPT
jgi:phage-related holin